MEKTLKLETMVCPRCGGSGEYSYNAIHGSRCYGCGGSGEKYTKRGAAAAAFLNALREVRADSIKPGDYVRVTGINSAKWYYVESVEIGEAKGQGCYRDDGLYQQVKLNCKDITCYENPDTMMRKAYSQEEKRAQFEKALAYQETLTKAGTPRKKG